MTLANVKARILDWYDESMFAKRRKLKALQQTEAGAADPKLETAAQMLHSIRHPWGYAPVCGRCRQDARIVQWALTDETPSKREAAS